MPSQADLLGHFLREGVLAKLRPTVEDSPTLGAADAGVLPVRCDASEAEAVAAGDGDGLTENILTDKATKLRLGQQKSRGHDLGNEGKKVLNHAVAKPLFSQHKYEAK